MPVGYIRLKDGVVRPGDIVLTTTGQWLSAAIRWATFGDVSHAMVCVADGSVVDATSEGVHARSVQRLLLDERYAVHVLRTKHPATTEQLSAIETFLRTRIGVEYSTKAAAQSLLGAGRAKKQQFCSRLVAQAYAEAGIRLVDNPDFCFPSELLQSPLLVEVQDPTEAVSAESAAVWEGIEDVPQRMRDAINAVLAGARKLSKGVQSFEDLNDHLLRHPEDDPRMCEVLQESGYLTVWRLETRKSDWHYSLPLMDALPADQVEDYCRRTLREEGTAPNRFIVNRGGYLALHLHAPLRFFAEMRNLYELLADLHRTRIDVATTWLESRGLVSKTRETQLRPHTPEWFEALQPWDPRKATMTRLAIQTAGSSEVCSVCGDDPASDYVLVAGIPAGGPSTLKLCADCLRLRRRGGEEFEPL
jgi:hypothetical protein